MDLQISVLQDEMVKLQGDLRESQAQNAWLMHRNEKLKQEVEELRDKNQKLTREKDELVVMKRKLLACFPKSDKLSTDVQTHMESHASNCEYYFGKGSHRYKCMSDCSIDSQMFRSYTT
jgi:predicted nuclease with TOPRIM domain